MSGALASAKLHRIKAAHRRRRRSTAGRFVQRYYDPTISRFLSVDPVTAYDNGDMRFFNRYAYVFNNPYKFTDPDGRSGRDRDGSRFAELTNTILELAGLRSRESAEGIRASLTDGKLGRRQKQIARDAHKGRMTELLNQNARLEGRL